MKLFVIKYCILLVLKDIIHIFKHFKSIAIIFRTMKFFINTKQCILKIIKMRPFFFSFYPWRTEMRVIQAKVALTTLFKETSIYLSTYLNIYREDVKDSSIRQERMRE